MKKTTTIDVYEDDRKSIGDFANALSEAREANRCHGCHLHPEGAGVKMAHWGKGDDGDSRWIIRFDVPRDWWYNNSISGKSVVICPSCMARIS